MGLKIHLPEPVVKHTWFQTPEDPGQNRKGLRTFLEGQALEWESLGSGLTAGQTPSLSSVVSCRLLSDH